jgi:hypothetical protein
VYKAKVKSVIIALDVKSSDEVAAPVYAGNHGNIKNLVENSYNQYGKIIGENFSIDELEFALNFLNVKYKVLDSQDVEILEKYEAPKAGETP